MTAAPDWVPHGGNGDHKTTSAYELQKQNGLHSGTGHLYESKLPGPTCGSTRTRTGGPQSPTRLTTPTPTGSHPEAAGIPAKNRNFNSTDISDPSPQRNPLSSLKRGAIEKTQRCSMGARKRSRVGRGGGKGMSDRAGESAPGIPVGPNKIRKAATTSKLEDSGIQ